MSDNTDPPAPEFTSVPVTLEEEMRRSYLDYAMSVIVSRALPDARDGLKPVHRRILFSMSENGYTPDKPHRKSARVVGDVIGKYHPHGELAIYDALVRMAQPFSLRAPLIDGQGNFGSVDGDQPAAMRYTEVRLSRPAMLLLEDIDKDTVDFGPNYDETEHEPKVLPARFPNLLVNGGSGIAVGMATNIPPHNPAEIMDALLHLIEHPEATLDDLMRIVPGPDFPTAGLIVGRAGIRSAFETGRGSLVLRAKCEFEEMRGGRTAIIVTELPYQVNKATLQEKTAELIRAKSIDGISDIRDESDRSGMRIVFELKRESTPEVVLNHLYRMTALQTSFGVNCMALDGGRPRLLGLLDALLAFMAFREDVILRRSRYLLTKARERAHLLVGLAIAVANIDEVIRLIRGSPDTPSARAALMGRDWAAESVLPLLALIDDRENRVVDGRVRLTEAQARGILDLRLARLTALERGKIDAEMEEVAGEITELLKILDSRPRRLEVMRDEFIEVRKALNGPRLTQIVDAVADQDDESLVEPGQMVVTITRDGFIKRTPLETFRQQNRGGRGRTGAATRGDDIVTRSFNAHTHQWVLFFSSGGKAYREKIWRLPEASPTSRGRALVNLLPELGGDGITAVLPLPQDESLWDGLHLVFATASGGVRRNRLSDFGRIRSSGIIAMKLDEGDHLIGVATCHEGDDVFLATRRGRCIRFQITDETLRVFSGRDSQGVRGIRLQTGDEVIGLSILRHVEWRGETPADRAAERAAATKAANARRRLRGEQVDASAETDADEEGEGGGANGVLSPEREEELAGVEQILLTVTDAGFGKRSSAFGYRVTGRGGMGIANMTLSPRTGQNIVASFPVHPDDGLMLVTDGGQVIRTGADQVRVTGRTSMGVRVLRVADGERVTSVFPILESPDSADDAADGMPPPGGLAGGVPPDDLDG